MTDKKLSELTAATGATGGDSLLLVQGGVSKQVTVGTLAAAFSGSGPSGPTGATGAGGATGNAGATGTNGATGAAGSYHPYTLTIDTNGTGNSVNASGLSQLIVTVHDSTSAFTLNVDDGQMLVVLFIQDSTGGWNCGITNLLPMPSITDVTLNQGPSIVTAFIITGFGGTPLLLDIIK
jgi:hypothetical protein